MKTIIVNYDCNYFGHIAAISTGGLRFKSRYLNFCKLSCQSDPEMDRSKHPRRKITIIILWTQSQRNLFNGQTAKQKLKDLLNNST